MPDFWLGICDLGQTRPATGSSSVPLLMHDLRHVAVEVIRLDGGGEFAVLLSGADGNDPPRALDCRIGFTNSPRGCNAWRDRGFPLVDAAITLDGHNMLAISTPYYQPLGAQLEVPALLQVGPLRFDGDPASTVALAPEYNQDILAPDSARPATVVRRRGATWIPARRQVMRTPAPVLQLNVANSRSPDLSPLATQAYAMQAAWSGQVDLPRFPFLQSAQTEVSPRADVFGVPAFRFDDVEAIGFRIDLPRDAGTQAALERLVRPLNFHLHSGDPSRAPDFRYESQSVSLVIELLRYGQMRLVQQDPPLTLLDYQSQHELVVRLLVGRVEDDGSPVHDEAVFVPAIFVDNPWSKALGRDMQGFPKTMAAFCIDTAGGGCLPLAPDGRHARGSAAAPVPLNEVTSIRLRDPTGGPLPQDWLMKLECNRAWYSDWDNFSTVSPGSAIAGLALSAAQGSWFDLSRATYLASFLRTAAGQFFNGFRSVQSSPLSALALGRTWVTGRFAVEDIVQLAFPIGTVTVAFNAPADAPAGWKKICALLPPPRSYDLHTTSWYRLKFAMTMTVDDGLEWTS